MANLIENDKRREILSLRAKGLSFAKIAESVGVAKQSVVDECKRNEEAIATLRALELEELYETHRISKEERIKAHATLLGRIRSELESRSLEDVPTDKLVDLYLKTSASLQDELIEPRFLSSEEQSRNRREREELDSLTSL